MPRSYAQIHLHVVFSTKHRTPWLRDRAISKELYAYIATVLMNLECPATLVNGADDHVHVLCSLSRKIAVMQLVEEIKKRPSKWLKSQGFSYRDFQWQVGYAAFSVSQSNIDAVKQYVASQEEHHRRMTFQEEFRALCERHGIEIDERFVWE